jgi:hypothetical protein
MEDDPGPPSGELPPDSLLPYQQWSEEAQRHVMIRALSYAAVNGLPGAHHFYISFRTSFPGVVIPPRLQAQYPDEMTIVLQHQFWDLTVDEATAALSVGLSFSGVGSILKIPFGAITAFADPHVHVGLRFTPQAAAPAGPQETAPVDATPEQEQEQEPQVVSLDAFRRRPAKD